MQALASIGSISRAGRQRSNSSSATPSSKPPRLGTITARSVSILGWLESRSVMLMLNSSACRAATATLIASTTSPPMVPIIAARTTRLVSWARTNARSRRGASR